MTWFSRCLAATAAVTVLGYATIASADYIIDETLSSLQMSIEADAGSFFLPISSPQSPYTDSDIAHPTGTISATRVGGLNGTIALNGGTFGFLDYAGGDIQPQSYPDGTDISPHVDPPGEAPAIYGFHLSVISDATLQGEVAFRALQGALTSTVLGMTAGSFDATLTSLGIPTGHADLFVFGPGGFGGLVPAADNTIGVDLPASTSANSSAAGLITQVGGVETLTLPIAVSYLQDLGGTAVRLNVTGTIVATGPIVPEPASLAMLGVGLLGLIAIGRRKV